MIAAKRLFAGLAACSLMVAGVANVSPASAQAEGGAAAGGGGASTGLIIGGIVVAVGLGIGVAAGGGGKDKPRENPQSP